MRSARLLCLSLALLGAASVSEARDPPPAKTTAVVQQSDRPAVATTDFYQLGAAHHVGRFSTSIDGFWIDRSHEQVYIPDDGTFEFKAPSRAYGTVNASTIASPL